MSRLASGNSDDWFPVIVSGVAGAVLAPEGKRLQGAVAFGYMAALVTRPEILRQWQYLESLRLEEERKRRTVAFISALGSVAKLPARSETRAAPRIERLPEADSEWLRVIVHPSVVLILGKRGSGKSALGYRLLEVFRHALGPYVLGVPREGERLLPQWIGMAENMEKVPQKSIVLVDEAHLRYHARESRAAQSREISRVLSLSRQMQQTLILISQEARQIDRSIASSANVVVFKDLGMLQPQFERRELTSMASQANEALATAKGDKRRWSYVFSPDVNFAGLLENEQPSFWSHRLSCLYANPSSPASSRVSASLTPSQKAEKAKQMRAGGASYQTISRALGVTRSTVLNYIRDYPYRQQS
jgi:DNA-binding CsgD family transcriptional regulator